MTGWRPLRFISTFHRKMSSMNFIGSGEVGYKIPIVYLAPGGSNVGTTPS